MGSFAETWLLAGGGLAAYTEDALDERNLDIPPEAVNLGLLKSPSVEKMIELDVDFAILSANLSEHVALREQLADAGIAAAYFSVETFDEYLDMLKICTDITGRGPDLYENTASRCAADRRRIARRGDKPGRGCCSSRFSTGPDQGQRHMTAKAKDLGCENIADPKDSLLRFKHGNHHRADPDYIFK
jgi:iron complex transport system substrate-binding protein